MSSQRDDVVREVCLPAGMALVVPPPAPEDIDGPRPATGCDEESLELEIVERSSGSGERRLDADVERG
jgi:hypothetical protein